MDRGKSIVTFIARWLARHWGPIIATLVIESMVLTVVTIGTASIVLAGDTYPYGGSSWSGNGDCWQPQTPLMCRATWTGKGSQIYMRLIDQLNDTALHNDANTACSNWTSAPGPQWCSWTARSNDTWTYLKIDDGIQAPNGITFNCVNGACPTSTNAGNILWSEIYVPHADHDFLPHPCTGVNGYWATNIFAHEMGHAYGLAHHGAACTNVTLMTSGSWSFTGPTSIDIGPFPGCSGGPSTGGVRCIYENT